MVQYCHIDNPFDPQEAGGGTEGGVTNDGVPPATDPMCREQNALQGRMTSPTNLPLKDVNRPYLTCMDSRVGYAAISAPGGDMGQFILGLGAAEYIIGYSFTPDDILHFFQQYVEAMGGGGPSSDHGKGYFSMCTDTIAHTTWFTTSKITGPSLLMQKWNPLDTNGRRRLLKQCALPEHVGDTLLKAMVTSEDGEKEWGVRKEVTESAIRAFYAIWFDPFNSLREHLLLPILSGEQKPSAVVNVESPEICHPLSPLVVQKIHTVTPTPGADLLQNGGEKDGNADPPAAAMFLLETKKREKRERKERKERKEKRGGRTRTRTKKESSLFLETKEEVSSSEAGVDERTNVGVDPIGDGGQILVHHYLAAVMYRRELCQL
jgi:hypothetical protein